ncbi:MAG TPA: bifunctional riboflavin kinase/FMN adenylyltransferase [Chloroflexi bacterium]|nr:bifunctional riboflavin kinase/FMN adenylyltransferase [Chloroflexota bacterium]
MPVTLEHSLAPNRGPSPAPAACTIGVFDGVHRGHQRLLAATVAAARELGGIAGAVTFEPHPRAVLDPANVPPELTTLDEKRERLMAAGMDRVVVVNFTREVSEWTAERFCARLLDRFDLRRLVVGPGFALGRDRRGDIDFLRRFGAEHGFTVDTVPAVTEEGEAISSTRIRSALVSGDVEMAAGLLGHPYFLDGTVERGDRVGWRLGFPTANLGVEPGKCLPELGIYSTWVRVRGEWRVAASSIGYRPTFGGDRLTVEAHLLDFDADIYGERVRLAFVHRLREERWYPDEAALIAQMRLDVAETRRLLGAQEPPAEL